MEKPDTTETTETTETANTLKHASREHSRHSPSGLEPILRCGGFLNDPHRDSSAADRGTLGHEAVETENPALIKNDEALVKAVELCIKYKKRLEAGATQIVREKRVKILDQFGSFDELIIHGNTAKLLDYKFAWNKYHADGMQAKAYVVGIFDEYPAIKEVEAHFILPFLGEVSVQKFDRVADYDQLVAEVRAVIERARRAAPEEYRVQKYCAYCARAAACPSLMKIAVELAGRYNNEEITLPEGAYSVHGSDFTDPNIVSELLKLAAPLEQMAESWRRGALRLRLEEGVDIPGWKLVQAKGKRSIVNPGAAYEAIRNVVPAEEIVQISTIPIGKLEDLYSSKAPKGKKTAWVAELNDKLADASAISEGATINKLVPDKK